MKKDSYIQSCEVINSLIFKIQLCFHISWKLIKIKEKDGNEQQTCPLPATLG